MGIAHDDHGHGIGAWHNFTVACGNLFAVLTRGKFSRKYGSFGKLYEKVHGPGFRSGTFACTHDIPHINSYHNLTTGNPLSCTYTIKLDVLSVSL